MARDSRNRTGADDSDTDSVSTDAQPASGSVVTLDYTDGKLIDRDTGEEVEIEEPPVATDLLPDWLWAQHNAAPPQESDE